MFASVLAAGEPPFPRSSWGPLLMAGARDGIQPHLVVVARDEQGQRLGLLAVVDLGAAGWLALHYGRVLRQEA